MRLNIFDPGLNTDYYYGNQDQMGTSGFNYVITSSETNGSTLYTNCKAEGTLNCIYNDEVNQKISYKLDGTEYYGLTLYFGIYPLYTYYTGEDADATATYDYFTSDEDGGGGSFYVETSISVCPETTISFVYFSFAAMS